jgi:hypothetical protein
MRQRSRSGILVFLDRTLDRFLAVSRLVPRRASAPSCGAQPLALPFSTSYRNIQDPDLVRRALITTGVSAHADDVID